MSVRAGMEPADVCAAAADRMPEIHLRTRREMSAGRTRDRRLEPIRHDRPQRDTELQRRHAAPISFPVLPGTIGPEVIDIRDAVRQDRQVHLRPGLPVDRRLRVDDHLHRRRQGRAALPRLPDRAARACSATSSRSAICCCSGELPNAKQKAEFVHMRHACTRWCTSR
mgnify:CR=1 FL=1